jgi:hypothetical protein
MDAQLLQDRIGWGFNTCARNIGFTADAYRPVGPHDPLDMRNRFLRLPVAFSSAEGALFARSNKYGNAIWHGLFDIAYIRPGDYLTCAEGVWFVADMQPLLPVLCVKTTRTVSFWQPSGVQTTGSASYSGVTAASTVPLMTNWPASVLGAGGAGSPEAGLPSDSTLPFWTILVPAMPGVVISPSDIMSDDLGRNAVVSASELTSLGWRISVKQATT